MVEQKHDEATMVGKNTTRQLTLGNISEDTRKTTNRGHSGNHQQGHSENHKQGTLGEPPAETLGQLQDTNKNKNEKNNEITYTLTKPKITPNSTKS